jgi:CubicO group peptidase (beta-lactamase class C family)
MKRNKLTKGVVILLIIFTACFNARLAHAANSFEALGWTSSSAPAETVFSLSGSGPKTVLLRAIAVPGISGITDPILTLGTNAGGSLLAMNDNWSANAAEVPAIQAALASVKLPEMRRGSRDSVLLVKLTPGTYTLRIHGKTNAWERVRAEVFLIPESLDLVIPRTFSPATIAATMSGEVPLLTVGSINSRNLATGTSGLVRTDANQRAASNAFYHLGSCGKAFTATLAGWLVDQGKLRWNTSLGELFPDLANTLHDDIKTITLEQLLAHRGGFAGYLDATEIATLPAFSGSARQQRKALLAHLGVNAPVLPVGEFAYSNVGYAVAGAMIEQAANATYEDLLRNHLIRPLGAEVLFGFPASAPRGRQTWGNVTVVGTRVLHDPQNPLFAPFNFPVYLMPAGLFSMTTDGFSRFVQMHLRGLRGEDTLLKPATLAYLHRPFGGNSTGYALGWEVSRVDGVITSQHDGSIGTYFAQMVVQTTRDRAAVAMTTASDEPASLAIEKAITLALGAAIRPSIEFDLPPDNHFSTPGSLRSARLRTMVAGNLPGVLRFTSAANAPYLFRAVGPGLPLLGRQNVVKATELVVRDRTTQSLIKYAKGWDVPSSNAWPLVEAARQAKAGTLSPGSNDSAVLSTVPAGNYEISAYGADWQTGVVSAEFYELDAIPTDPQGSLTKALEEFGAKYDRQAVAVAVTRGEELLRASASGKANVEAPLDATADTGFLVASISKTITATAVMQQVEKGSLNLDVDVSGYLPFTLRNPHAQTRPITLRQLLSHTSSITDNAIYSNYDEFYTYGTDPTISLADFCTSVFKRGENRYSTVTFSRKAPGSSYEYSNIAYALLGWIVERVTEQPFDVYCMQSIFKPLGMNQTSWRLADATTRPLAMPYNYLDEPIGHYSFADYPSGSVFTSANDLSRFLRAIVLGGAFNGQRILKEETVALMLKPAFPKVRGAEWQGLGFAGFSLPDGRVFLGHSGGEQGVATGMFFNPGNGCGLIALMNKDVLSDSTLFEILALLYNWATSQP